MLIPHFNPYGKLNGGPGYIKEIVCPKIGYLTVEKLPSLLAEISEHTNVKWFKYDKRDWIHSLSFLSEHQKIDTKKLGKDQLPNYSRTSPELVGDLSETSREQVAVQCEREPEREREREEAARTDFEPEIEPLAKTPDCLSEHSWDRFKALMPTRNGKFLDEDAVREKWIRSRAIHNQVLAALVNYKASAEVQDGAVMSPMKFISGRFKMWLTPETQPLGGAGMPREPDYSWKADDAQFEKDQEEHRRKVASGEIAAPAGNISSWRKAIPQTT